MPVLYMLTLIDPHWPSLMATYWSVWFKPPTWQHLKILGPLAKELSKESSKETKSTNSLEPSLDNSLVKVPRMLRCCHLDGLNQIDQHKVDASLIYADQQWLALTGINKHQMALTSIYKTCNYFILVSWNQTMNKTTSKGSWALGQGIVQGKFQGNKIYKFLGTFLGQLLGQGPKDVEMLSPWWFESNWPA